jgi:hypothetical protein
MICLSIKGSGGRSHLLPIKSIGNSSQSLMRNICLWKRYTSLILIFIIKNELVIFRLINLNLIYDRASVMEKTKRNP